MIQRRIQLVLDLTGSVRGTGNLIDVVPRSSQPALQLKQQRNQLAAFGGDASSGDSFGFLVQAASVTAWVCNASSNTTGVNRPSPFCLLLR